MILNYKKEKIFVIINDNEKITDKMVKKNKNFPKENKKVLK